MDKLVKFWAMLLWTFGVIWLYFVVILTFNYLHHPPQQHRFKIHDSKESGQTYLFDELQSPQSYLALNYDIAADTSLPKIMRYYRNMDEKGKLADEGWTEIESDDKQFHEEMMSHPPSYFFMKRSNEIIKNSINSLLASAEFKELAKLTGAMLFLVETPQGSPAIFI